MKAATLLATLATTVAEVNTDNRNTSLTLCKRTQQPDRCLVESFNIVGKGRSDLGHLQPWLRRQAKPQKTLQILRKRPESLVTAGGDRGHGTARD